MNPGEIKHSKDGTKHGKMLTPGELWAQHSPSTVLDGAWSTQHLAHPEGHGERSPATHKSASHDSYLGGATENAQYMCWSHSCPLPWCLSHVDYNPTVTGMGIRVSMSSSKTLPLQSKTEPNPEEQAERGTKREERHVARGRKKETY